MTASSDPKPPTPFEQLGGVAGVRALVDRFYDLMDLEPEFAGLRALHPTTLDGSRDKFARFLFRSKRFIIVRWTWAVCQLKAALRRPFFYHC